MINGWIYKKWTDKCVPFGQISRQKDGWTVKMVSVQRNE